MRTAKLKLDSDGVAIRRDHTDAAHCTAVPIKLHKMLGCDVEEFRSGGRVSPQRSLERDLLLYLIRQMGVLTDHQLGVMFGLGNSAVSRRAGIFKAKLHENKALQRKLEQLKSKIKT